MTALRIAVIGVGHLGQHHARLLAAMDAVELVAVLDTNAARAGEIAGRYGTTALTEASALAGRVGSGCIATPTR